MNVENLATRFETPDWPSEFADKLGAEAPSTLSSQEFRFLGENAKHSLDKGRVGHARNWIALGLYLDPLRMVGHCKRDGLFRASKYGFQGNHLQRLLDGILELRAVLGLHAGEIRYLESVRSLLTLSAAVLRTRQNIMRELKRREKVALKSLVATVDLLFLKPREPDYGMDCGDSRYYTIEQHAGALSLLVHMFSTLHGVDDRHFGFVDEQGIQKGVYERLLVAACKLLQYQEAEVWVDVFSYTVVNDGATVLLAPGDPRLEQSIRLGYIQTEVQKNLTFQEHFNVSGDSGVSVQEWAKQLYAAHGTKLVQLREEPIQRYALFLPMAPKLLEPFRSDALFQEDIGNLHAVAKAQYALPETVATFRLTDGLTLFDLLKIQRFLDFLRGLMAERLLPLLETDPGIAIRSLLPVIPTDTLLDVLTQCVSEEAANTFLAIATYDHTKSPRIFDVQYHPLIRGKETCLLPLNVLCRSDLIRNLLYTQGKKVAQDNVDDPMQGLVAQALRERFPEVAVNLKLKVDGQQREIDILVIVERRLLVIECKSAFHPCGAHELRTSHDHILKASRQLDRLEIALQRPQIRQNLMRRLNWKLDEFDGILTCIVTGNRLFNGYKIRDHPVRQAYEMANMIRGGTALIGEEEFRLWRDTNFQEQDLLDYLDGSTLHAELFNAMEEVTFQYTFEGGTMNVSTFALYPEGLEDAVSRKFGSAPT